ncbi:probable Methionine aminopeptidase 2 homolog NFIA_034070 [Rhynchosporium graminicola]|uniref:Methionine aminopeptidase 2 n=1 Tax=Rhynchosporium graminicola TaxID=2792576 RepID=A0A1E1LMM6_9HELO|nr:probable Methionine aminopeptidase 2 homolog NFIA_034070 [Rhynchosporium commune]
MNSTWDQRLQKTNTSDSGAFKPANANPNVPKNGSSSADLDQGFITADDDEDDDAKGEAEMSISANAATELKQSNPPRILLSTLFPVECPTGELIPYENISRETNEETRYNSKLWDVGFLNDYRQAAEIHRQVRYYAQRELIKPGGSLLSIAEGIEDSVRALSGHSGLEPGDGLISSMGFPSGLCRNNETAHYTPNPGDKEVLTDENDVLKVDFGVHINGRIVDSAFTIAFDHKYDNLLAAVKAATNTGIEHAGVDARMKDIGAAIQEVMESYEVELDGKLYPVKAIRSLTGHNILRYHIHGDEQVPFVKNDSSQIMEEGDIFAIETFGSTGKGYTRDDGTAVYGYGRDEYASTANLRSSSAKSLLKIIDANFGTIVFNRRYLERLGVNHYHLGLRELVNQCIVETCGQLADVNSSYTAQFEHTILLQSGGKEVISRGDDY